MEICFGACIAHLYRKCQPSSLFKKYLVRIKGYKPKPFNDFRVIIQLFIPALAVQIYAMLDKSMIGWITHDNAQNGYYEQSEKIIKMCLMLITALITVTMPRISKLFAEGNKREAEETLYKSARFVWFSAFRSHSVL